ncbi:MAG: hypothetical protein M5R36_15745 [Deltaproteobacteria bacterium]|nr:hypothetical protein [Deltaproteobacteria bacterium]
MMPWTGFYTLVFLGIHLVNFRMKREGMHYTGGRTIYGVVSDLYENPAWGIFYSVSMIVVASHVAHGMWSAFQTLGLGTANARFTT